MASPAPALPPAAQQLRTGVDGLLAEVGGLLADLLDVRVPHGSPPSSGSEDEGGLGREEGEEDQAHRRILDAQLHHFWATFYKLRERHGENTLSVAVLALTKSGEE